MSRLTGNEVQDLREAYSAVYAPQELTEEQIWVEVENWVNSLVQEGYDLSEYTWEEMYENYLMEVGGGVGAGLAATQARQAQAQAAAAMQGLSQGKTFGVSGPLGLQSGTTVKLDPTATKLQGRTVLSTSSPAFRGGRNIGSAGSADNTIRLGGQNFYRAQLGGRDVYVGAKPPGPAPAGPPAAKPPGPAGAPRPSGGISATTSKPAPSGATFSPASLPTSEKIKSGMQVWSQQRQAGDLAGATETGKSIWAMAHPDLAKATKTPNPLMKGFNTSTSTTSSTSLPTTPSVKSTLPTIPSGSAPTPLVKSSQPTNKNIPQKLNQDMNYDAFDIILEYLTSEGHVDSLDEALYVMMEMDSDMIQSICEAHYGTAKGRKKLAKKIRKGEDVGKKGPGFEAIVNKASAKYGKKRATKIAAAAMWKNLGK